MRKTQTQNSTVIEETALKKPARKKMRADSRETTVEALTNPIALGVLKEISVDSIQVGPWHRSDLGKINDLARSMQEVGLIQPILLDQDYNLVAGYRRLAAAKKIGWSMVPCRIVDIEDPLLATAAEDHQRKPLNASEKYAVVAAMAERAKDSAWRSRALGGRLAASESKGRLDEFLSAHVGLSREGFRQMRAVLDAAREDPDAFGDLAEELDRDGKVNRHYKTLMNRRQRASTEPVQTVIVRPGWTQSLSSDFGVRDAVAAVAGLSSGPALLMVTTKLAGMIDMVNTLKSSGFNWSHCRAGSKEDHERTWIVAVRRCDASVADDWLEFLPRGFAAMQEAAEPIDNVTIVDLLQLAGDRNPSKDG